MPLDRGKFYSKLIPKNTLREISPDALTPESTPLQEAQFFVIGTTLKISETDLIDCKN